MVTEEKGLDWNGYECVLTKEWNNKGASSVALANGNLIVSAKATTGNCCGSANASANFKLRIKNIKNIKNIYVKGSAHGWNNDSYAKYFINLYIMDVVGNTALPLANDSFSNQLIRKESNFLIASDGSVLNVGNTESVYLIGTVNASVGANYRSADATITINNINISSGNEQDEDDDLLDDKKALVGSGSLLALGGLAYLATKK